MTLFTEDPSKKRHSKEEHLALYDLSTKCKFKKITEGWL
jgi:hypothetical protein